MKWASFTPAHHTTSLLSLLCLPLLAIPAQAMQWDQHNLAFDGYLRIGAGVSEDGKAQASFQAPQARSKYRLGNEADTRIQLGVSHRYQLYPRASAPTVQTYVMVEGWGGQEEDIEVDGLKQAYVNFENFFSNGVSVWMGRRIYDQKRIHLTDHAWLNTGEGAHFGFGFENWQVGPGKLAFATFRHHDPKGLSLDGERTGTLYSTAFDLRYTGIALGRDHTLNFWGGLTQRHENSDLDYLKKMGVGGGLWIDSSDLFGGQHTLAALLKGGPTITQGDFNALPIIEDQGFAVGGATVLEINSNYYREVNTRFAFETMLLFRNEIRGISTGIEGDQLFWFSGGGRLVQYLSDHLSLAYELGADSVVNEINDTQGALVKGTLALQLAPQRGYFQRPVMRFFLTVASWDDDFKGAVGGSAYAEDNAGLTLGAQLETWW